MPGRVRDASAKSDPVWMQGIKTKGGINAAHIFDTSGDVAKKWVAQKFKESPTHFTQLAGLFAKLAHGISTSTLGRVVDLELRLARVESAKGLDAEITDEVAAVLKRVETLEANVAESGMRFRGYWREGLKAKRNDLTTEGGSLWIAIRATDERPHRTSSDWVLAARAGRDAA